MIAALVAAAVASSHPNLGRPLDYRVEVIELNHVFNDHRRHRFSQVIFWEHDAELDCLVVRDYRMLSPHRTQSQPFRIELRGRHVVATCVDECELVRIQADTFVETWTAFDPEVDNRSVVAKSRRTRIRAGGVTTTWRTP